MAIKRSGALANKVPHPHVRHPVLVMAPKEDLVTLRLQEMIRAVGWVPLVVVDSGRFRWASTVHHPVVVLLVAGRPEWTTSSVTSIRSGTESAIVVVGDMHPRLVIDCLGAGADTVINPGTQDDELLARIEALVRRAPGMFAEVTRFLQAGDLRLDLRNRQVEKNGEVVTLTSTEFKVLACLMRHPTQAVARCRLIEEVWGRGAINGINTLRIFIRRIRVKLGDSARDPDLILSVRGFGYKFAPNVLELSDDGRTRSTSAGEVEAFDDITEVATRLARCATIGELSETLVSCLVERGSADAVAIHHVQDGRLDLQAQRGLSSVWVQQATSLPASGGLASVASLRACSEVHVDLTSPRKFRETFRMLRYEDMASTLFVPFKLAPGVSGCIGMTRRAIDPWTPSSLAHMRALAAMYGSHVAARQFPPQAAAPASD